jgi:hypothetical protein
MHALAGQALCQFPCRAGKAGRARAVSRILYPGWGGDHLSGTPVARRLERPLPEGSGEQPSTRSRGAGSPSYLVLLRVGFTRPASHLTAGGLLPRHFTLTGARHVRGRRCLFCGTFLRVTPTGRYPAPCSSESGLSSTPTDTAQRSPARLDPTLAYGSRPPNKLTRQLSRAGGRRRGWSGSPAGSPHRKGRRAKPTPPLPPVRSCAYCTGSSPVLFCYVFRLEPHRTGPGARRSPGLPARPPPGCARAGRG